MKSHHMTPLTTLLPQVTVFHHFGEYHKAYTRFILSVNNVYYADYVHVRAFPPEHKQR